MNGFINLLKPSGMSSSDAVTIARRITGQKKCGHSGTLDPLAAGLLPLCMGRATKLFDYIMEKNKEYLAELTLGVETDTQDADGEVIATGDADAIGEDDVRAVLAQFRGVIQQQPPMYSALVHQGKKLYKLARGGEEIERAHREITITALELVERTGPRSYLLRIGCTKGTYVRTLCTDIGRALGCRAYLSFLLRTASGVFTLENTVTIEELETLRDRGQLNDVLLPMDHPLGHLPRVDCPPGRERWLLNGLAQGVKSEPVELARVYAGERFLGLGGIALREGRTELRLQLYLHTEDTV